MKRLFACLLAAGMLAGVFAGCSATGRVDPYGMYGNVSTTRDGRVNGTNDSFHGMNDQTHSGTNGRTGSVESSQTQRGTNDRPHSRTAAPSGSGTDGQIYNGTNTQPYNGTTGRTGTGSSTAPQRGTGMAGGR